MKQMAQPRKRPELLLAAAALLVCAGLLVATGAGRGKEAAAANLITGQSAANPFEQNGQAALSSVTDAAGSYVIGYTGVVIYPPESGPESGTQPADNAAANTGQPNEPPMEYAQPPTQPQTQTLPQTRPSATEPKASAPLQAVNINTASQAQLETLPGIGPVKAQAILDWRAAHGSFSNVYQLLEVKGIGEKTMENLLPYVVV